MKRLENNNRYYLCSIYGIKFNSKKCFEFSCIVHINYFAEKLGIKSFLFLFFLVNKIC